MNADPVEKLSQEQLKIEYIPIYLIRPDPAQPRRILPESIYTDLYEGRLTPHQALREFIHQVEIIARQKGHPFSSIEVIETFHQLKDGAD